MKAKDRVRFRVTNFHKSIIMEGHILSEHIEGRKNIRNQSHYYLIQNDEGIIYRVPHENVII